MHHAGKRPVGVFLGQDVGHVVIRVAGVNDQRQASVAGHCNMGAQGRLLGLSRVSRVVVIQSGFADPDHFRVFGQRQQVLIRGHRFCGDAHRVGARSIEHRRMGFGDGTHGRFIGEFGANRDHAGDASVGRALDDVVQIPFEVGKVKVTMAVGDLRCVAHACPAC